MGTVTTIIVLVLSMAVYERIARKDLLEREDDLGSLPSKIKAWRRVRRAHMLVLRDMHQGTFSWRKRVKAMSDKIRNAMAVSAFGSGEEDDGVAPYKPPHRGPSGLDAIAVADYQSSKDEVAYLQRAALRSAHPELSTLLAKPTKPEPDIPADVKSGVQARPGTVTPIRRRKHG